MCLMRKTGIILQKLVMLQKVTECKSRIYFVCVCIASFASRENEVFLLFSGTGAKRLIPVCAWQDLKIQQYVFLK